MLDLEVLDLEVLDLEVVEVGRPALPALRGDR